MNGFRDLRFTLLFFFETVLVLFYSYLDVLVVAITTIILKFLSITSIVCLDASD